MGPLCGDSLRRIEFIWTHLYFGEPARERGVRTTDTAFGTVPETIDDRDARSYAPCDFLRQFGSVIAVCLSLALLAHVLVAFVGVY